MKKSWICIFVIFFSLITYQAMAGWVITQRHSNQDGLIQYETLTIQDNVVKSTGLDGIFIFNLNSRQFILADETKKVFWEGSIDEFRSSYYNSMKTIIDELTKDLPQDQRAMYKVMFDQTINMYAKPDQSAIDSVKIEVRVPGDSEDIVGFGSSKYEIYIGGKLREQMWISSLIPVNKDLDTKKFASFMREIQPSINGEYLYKCSDAYLELWKKGFPMRTIDEDDIQVEVIKVEETQIPTSEFSLAAGFKEVSLGEIIRLALIGSDGVESEEGSDY